MSGPRSKLLELLRESPAHKIVHAPPADLGVADVEPFPFLAIVGQREMKLALLLAVINPHVGGVLLFGPRGTAKTTAVRALTDLLPHVRRSLCVNGCTEEMAEAGGMDAICDACREKVGYGEPLTALERVRIVELPLNARLEDVIGGINERLALEQQRVRLEKGILAHADGHILYVDEVNLLDDVITDAILDAAAQGHYTVRRGPLKLTYRARFRLVGSMNPEEGRLRPQIMDRFGLRAVVRGLSDPALRYRSYQHAMWYKRDPAGLAAAYADETLTFAEEVEEAQSRLPAVTIDDDARDAGLHLIREMAIDSHRAEITLFEAARALAAADERETATVDDIRTVAPIALRLRRSHGLDEFLRTQQQEDAHLNELLSNIEETE